MAGEPDPEIVLKLRKGDASALHEAYRRFQPRIFSYLARLSGRHEVAQDLSSEVWCRAVAKRHTLRPDSQLLPWLFTIARNLFFSYCRWRRRDEHYLNELELVHGRVDPPPTPLEVTLSSEQEALLEEALQRLPQRYRDVLILVGIEGLSHEQAAQVSGIRCEAVRKRFSRGVQLMKEAIPRAGKAMNGGGAS
ncbi:MAG: RNA polymerase sigma factor [Candidatus Aminicenantes bacterium]|nr:RNA polymerase sigma factor [Candidatus Aminicenantes bacterium]